MRQGIRFLTRPITIRYYVALVLTGLVVTASYVLLASALEQERELFDIVDVARQQVEAVEGASNLASLIVADKSNRQVRNAELIREIRKIDERNGYLSLRDGEHGIPPRMQAILRKIYYANPHHFDGQMKSYLQSLTAVLGAGNDPSGAERSVRTLREITGPVIRTYDLMARNLRKEAIAGLDRVRFQATVLWGLTLIILAVEVPLIFRPMVRHAAETMSRIQQARREAEEHAAASEAARKGQASFIRTMSHELRTPLNGILGMAQLLHMRGLPPKEDEYVRDIHAAGGHLLELINSILEFSRLEAGHVTIERRPGVLRDVLVQTVSLMRPLAADKSLTLENSWDPKLSEYYCSDNARIREVLLNLIGNAIKFTPRGSVHVRARYEGTAGPEADYVRFEVEDTGIGVPPDYQSLIFQEFQQADNSLARKYEGTGLGLAISQRLVHLMDGRMGLESEEGGGSLFWFTLPLERTAQDAVVVAAPAQSPVSSPGAVSQG